jgi:uncharacterized protein YprB with RNaseH-like and TPR domain
MSPSPPHDESVFDLNGSSCNDSTTDPETAGSTSDQVPEQSHVVSLSQSADILAFSSRIVIQRGRGQLRDVVDYFEPDGILLSGPDPDPRAEHILEQTLGSEYRTFCPGLQDRLAIDVLNGVQLVITGDSTCLENLIGKESDELNPEVETYILSDALELQTNLTTLETELVGQDDYTAHLQPETLTGSYTHISTGLPSDYYQNWDDLAVLGGGSDLDEPWTPIPCLTLRGDGTVSTRTLSPDKLGLQALHQVGRTTAQRLREAGYQSRTDVARETKTELASVSGIGEKTAETISNSARAVTEGEIVRTGGGSEELPTRDPIHIDIETDGLNPTIVWLIGVYDTAHDTYIDFVQKDPGDPGSAITDFMAWYVQEGDNRPLVAYNGWGFDFDVLYNHILEHAQVFLDEWESTYRFDPYDWAVKQSYAVFPGHTNKLEDVAEALNWETDNTGLSGETVARKYRQWMYDRTPATELDWERHREYCEDDVRSLAYLYEQLKNADRLVASSDNPDTQNESVQGTLTDW